MTKEQQKIVDGFHEKAISLILKRSQVRKYGTWAEEEAINREIFKIEDERRKYERDNRTSREKESEIEGSLREVEAGN
jgi:hypothetical protein